MKQHIKRAVWGCLESNSVFPQFRSQTLELRPTQNGCGYIEAANGFKWSTLSLLTSKGVNVRRCLH